MKRAQLLVAFVLAPVAWVLLSETASGQTVPRLEHTAPWLGHTLTLTIDGAQPFAAVRLLRSDAAGSLPTVYGLFELDRSATQVVATGSTGVDGRLAIDIDLPLDPALAETQAHYQALVQDPAAPVGFVLSEAAHLRRLGARMYVGCRGLDPMDTDGPQPGGLVILSAVTRQIIATLDYGEPTPEEETSADAQPVFAANHARGAVITPAGALQFFEPFFGGALQDLPLMRAADRLATDAQGTQVFALETGLDANGDPSSGAVLHAIDFESATPTNSLQLQRSSSGQWLTNPEGSVAYVIGLDPSGGLPLVHRIALPALTELDALPIGVGPDSHVTDLSSWDSSLYATTFDQTDCITGPVYGTVTRIDYGFDPPRVTVQQVGDRPDLLALVPERGMLFNHRAYYCFGPGGRLDVRRMSAPGIVQSLFLPASVADGFPHDMAGEFEKLWIAVPLTYDGNHRLLWLDLDGFEWTEIFTGAGRGPHEVEVVRDALVHVGCTTLPYLYSVNGSEVAFVDPVTGALDEVVVPREPESLLAVPIPGLR